MFTSLCLEVQVSVKAFLISIRFPFQTIRPIDDYGDFNAFIPRHLLLSLDDWSLIEYACKFADVTFCNVHQVLNLRDEMFNTVCYEKHFIVITSKLYRSVIRGHCE